MSSLIVIIVIMFMAFIVPSFYPYSYEQQIRGSENLGILQYSKAETERMEAGERCSPLSGNRQPGAGYHDKNSDGQPHIAPGGPCGQYDHPCDRIDLVPLPVISGKER